MVNVFTYCEGVAFKMNKTRENACLYTMHEEDIQVLKYDKQGYQRPAGDLARPCPLYSVCTNVQATLYLYIYMYKTSSLLVQNSAIKVRCSIK